MSRGSKPLGIMMPQGGGDPIPLFKQEIVVGRRPTCDVRLDFENISGKHCMLRLINGVWHVRDLGSTNGTAVNRQMIDHEHGLMPDDELSIASHNFTIDYDPVSQVQETKEVLEQELGGVEARGSLIEMAGLTDPDRRQRPGRATKQPANPIRRPDAEGAEFADPIPRGTAPIGSSTGPGPRQVSDDDFFRMIEDDVKKGR